MAGETHGSKTKVFAAGYNLSKYFQSASAEDSIETAEVSTFLDLAKRYIAGLEDGTVSFEGIYSSDTPGGIRDALRTALGATPRPVCVMVEGDAIGVNGDALSALKTAKSVSSEIGDAVKTSVELQSNTGLEEIVSQHAMVSEAASANFAEVDNGASTVKGGVGYLQVPTVTGTLTVKIQHRAADIDPWVDLITFAAVTTARSAERIAVAGTVQRKVRAIATIVTGPATFFVGFGRRPANL